eukprot:1877445-Ditylum_brightwellii.AAC.1
MATNYFIIPHQLRSLEESFLRSCPKQIQGLRDCGMALVSLFVRILHPASWALEVLRNLLPDVLAKLSQ